MTVDVRRADSRFKTEAGWLDSRHCFSFGHHYDPRNTHHGLLLVSNDDVVQPNTGFSTHPHRDMEIVTWVLDGELEHTDTLGNKGIIYPGLAQRMSAGRGIWHSEINSTRGAPVHFVQMWVLPDTEAIDPSYEQLEIDTELNKGGLVPIASGRGHQAAISIRQQGAVLWGGKLRAGELIKVPDNAFVHVYVARGDVELENAGKLVAGDSVRLTAAGAPTLTAGAAGAEVLIWEMNAGLRAA
jgi:redox-sensitive bicupin YhaK (pirin superfamily)